MSNPISMSSSAMDFWLLGNGARPWGDNLDAPYLLARDGGLDVLTLEYLAELTMAILVISGAKDPTAGLSAIFLSWSSHWCRSFANRRACGLSPTRED